MEVIHFSVDLLCNVLRTRHCYLALKVSLFPRIPTAEPKKLDFEDDPRYQDFMRRWREWQTMLDLEANEKL